MEFVEVSNVTFPVGIEYTRRTLLRLFRLIHNVEDIVLDVRQGQAIVSFAESSAAQEALISFDGFVLFGRALSVRIAPPPASPVAGYIVTSRVTRYLLIHNAPYLAIVVKLKHVSGVESVTSAGVNRCFVVTQSVDDATQAKVLVGSHCSRWGTAVLISFLRKL
ncbi:hypothetical protein ABB37_04157 [Leptomonas pyrrhocoris]|uniref:RRM domain-containing protein n=1 Tax=Leptomonas pyrrhocoris TaxID=157538 RepID=A0A0M9G4F8_LEPPY|nr:hypothetical protein ABB37_04157 [Leptomonas pyrrhocoris]KPA81916.1 hypothetical protein ABB37_04157 [Leptomonas pyrrhocoris]|eukprot:XP_015660355.1 hypothetical protein ABB37_04157 [Leptomonas pyrrhocoris]